MLLLAGDFVDLAYHLVVGRLHLVVDENGEGGADDVSYNDGEDRHACRPDCFYFLRR